MKYPDIVVVGGGIVGCACAYYLARNGVKVHLLERGPLGSGASKAGMMHIVTWEQPDIHLKLSKASKKLYADLSQELPLDINYRETGSIAIIETPGEAESVGATVSHLQAYGLKCRQISGEELGRREPNIAHDVAGGVYFEEDAQVNPLKATQALAFGAQTQGAIIERFSEVIGLELSGNKNRVIAIQTARNRISTGGVVIAAGAWTNHVAKMAGIEVPISPRKGTLAITAPVSENYIHCKTMLSTSYMDAVHGGSSADIAVAANLQQTKNGNLLLGSSRQFVGFDLAVDTSVISMILTRNLRFFPFIAKVPVIRFWIGFRPYTPDLLPIISSVDSIQGMYIASGHEGLGITEAPITGKLISQLITGQQPDISMKELLLSRFKMTLQ